MAKLKLEISISLDGFVSGPEPSLADPLGKGGEALHGWGVKLDVWRRAHGLEGGESNPDGEVMAEVMASTGATIVGRGMFSGGSGRWEDDPNADGRWGDDPPFDHDLYVLTHHAREPVVKNGPVTYHFVTGGIEVALERARASAGDLDVTIGGGADVARQYINAGLLDEMQLHVVPILLGSGIRLLDGVDPATRLTLDRVVDSPEVTHLRYRVGGA